MHHDTSDGEKQKKVLLNRHLIPDRSYTILDIEIDPDCRPASVLANSAASTCCGRLNSSLQNNITLYRSVKFFLS